MGISVFPLKVYLLPYVFTTLDMGILLGRLTAVLEAMGGLAGGGAGGE